MCYAQLCGVPSLRRCVWLPLGLPGRETLIYCFLVPLLYGSWLCHWLPYWLLLVVVSFLSYGLTVELYKQSGCVVVVVFHMLSHKFPLRLRELCVKLMFLHPTDYGRKAEELLWRKVYYEVIQLIKTNKKASDGCPRALHTEV